MKLIAAADKHWGIGKNGGLLFHIPEDMKFFRSMTQGKVVVMGRKTLESMPNGKPLPNRVNIVLSHDTAYHADGVTVCHTEAELADTLASFDTEDIFIIGGAQIYAQFLEKCDTAYVTRIDADGGAQVFLPNIDAMSDWTVAQQSEEKEHNGLRFRFMTYIKK